MNNSTAIVLKKEIHNFKGQPTEAEARLINEKRVEQGSKEDREGFIIYYNIYPTHVKMIITS